MIGVDVIIVCRNHSAALTATLAGLATQSVAPARVVVVDNDSDDGCAVIADGFADRLPVSVVRWYENRGFSAAVNAGIRETASPWVLSLNPDCRLAPDFLGELIAAAAARSEVGAACGLLFRAQGDALAATEVVDSAGMVVTASGRHFDRGAGKAVAGDLGEPAFVFGASGAAALYRRAALDDVAYPGGEVFDERFFAYREDADLAWRLQRRGWSCLFWPFARGWHARGLKPETARVASPEINRLSVRNRFLLRWSNADWRWRLGCLPWWLIRDTMVVAACFSTERSSLPGLGEAWRLRHAQLDRGRKNTRRVRENPWRTTSWFTPWGRVRRVPK